MKVVILQSNYLPWKGYFDLINEADVFVFYDCVKYTKNDWRNRNQIYTKNGKQWLTIPMSLKATSLPINEVRITDSRWQDDHFKSLYYGYKNAPYFHQLEELMQVMLRDRKWEKLSDLNQFSVKYIANKLGITTPFMDSRDFVLVEGRVERLVDVLVQLGATEYLSGMKAKDYIAGYEHLFETNNITLIYKTYTDYPEYRQLHPVFDHNVSIVDMIANLSWDDIGRYIYGHRKEPILPGEHTQTA